MIPRSGKLVFLIRSLATGGAQRQLVLLASELHRRGLRVSVATYYAGGSFEQELIQAGVPLHCLNKSGRWDLLGFMIRLLRWLWNERPAIVHGYMSSENLLLLVLKPVLRMRGIAVVCGVRASAVCFSSHDRSTRWVEQSQLSALRFADAVVCNSIAGSNLVVAAGTPKERCFTVENGIDTARYRHSEQGRSCWRREWGIDRCEVLVGMVGRHDPIKGYEHFIDAAVILAKRHPHLRFVVVGAEVRGYSDHLRARVSLMGLTGRWTWAGHGDNLGDIYSAFDVLCLASISEGFPNVVGEAMSCGLPCVVTNVGDAARLLGDNGWVVPPACPDSLAVGVANAVEALPHWDREQPRQRISENYSINHLVDRTLAALSLCGERVL